MNLIKKHNIKVIDHRKLLSEAKKLYRKNRLHESISILQKLIHHGFGNDEVTLLLARNYDKLCFLTSEAEYEEAALVHYNELINHSQIKKYKKKALKLRKKLVDRITTPGEAEKKAWSKAEELAQNYPKSAKAWFMLAANFPVRKNPLFVIDAYKNALKLNENYILAIFRLAYLHQHYLQDTKTAISYYLKMIKIPPHRDTIEPEAVNVKTLIEGCTELSDIFIFMKNYKKVLSAFDYSVKLFKEYQDILSIHDLKRLIKNSCFAASNLGTLSQFKKHILKNYNIDIDNIIEELGISF